ncbi:Zinc finger protein ZPR1-like [Vitis vinifera]|uniref:Zinc finger protein ZPR1-like n=1 Tax=Vitis vinifera TaxID=29760 RepID=A0A438E3L7_VITVI|nr:Zinc finger protein ZPR1-like [Vitis vinifera]
MNMKMKGLLSFSLGLRASLQNFDLSPVGFFGKTCGWGINLWLCNFRNLPGLSLGVVHVFLIKIDYLLRLLFYYNEFKIPELDFEIPPEAQRGSLSTVEGILTKAVDDLQALQEERKKVDSQTAEAIDQFLLKLKACATGDSSFTFNLDDPAGNSFIENPFAPSPDPSLTIKFYKRSPEQQASLGYLVDSSQLGESCDEESIKEVKNTSDQMKREPHGSIGAAAGHRAIAQVNSAEIAENLFRYSTPEEVMTFPSTCGACAARCETRMFVTNIPYFQEVIVMASSCDGCGYRNSEHYLTVAMWTYQSDTADLERVHGFTFGDSLDDSKRSKWQDFRVRLSKLLSLEEPWTLIIDDALANSFVAPTTDISKMTIIEEYERSWEQNEELGLNDMDTSSADAAYN